MARPHVAKGRTNIELREQFILADGVSQSMTAFKPRIQSPATPGSKTPAAGPITKVGGTTFINEIYTTTLLRALVYVLFLTLLQKNRLYNFKLRISFKLKVCSMLILIENKKLLYLK